MRLYLLRHANADWPDWPGDDSRRPLTAKGRSQARRVAKFLRRAGVRLDLVATSPYPRAAQTAEIVAEKFALPVIMERALEPGFGVAALARILKRHSVSELMLVGHEPDLSGMIRSLTGGNVRMSKAAVACLEPEGSSGEWRLLWLLSPKCINGH
jgi:phosphohistidine phosphatase